ncbi:MAG: hypothetical protein ACM30G_17565 [Micromonosporaceae bacterium]
MPAVGRQAGRNARIYLGHASGADASPLAYQAEWTINFGTPKIDVTAFGDANKTTVMGLPEATGSFTGFYDDTTNQTYTAAVDGVARKFYLYPNANLATRYFFGTINPDANFGATVTGAVTVSSAWEAASQIQLQG